jgi:hypothetical protein
MNFIDGDLMQASDGNFWGSFLGVPGIVFSTTPSESFLENIELNAVTNGEEPFGNARPPMESSTGCPLKMERRQMDSRVTERSW